MKGNKQKIPSTQFKNVLEKYKENDNIIKYLDEQVESEKAKESLLNDLEGL